jgi:hypothetical protein
MKIIEFKYYNKLKNKCGIDILYSGENTIVLLTELKQNHGVSVTNAWEYLATLIYNHILKGHDPSKIIWVEHYEDEPENFSIVFLDYINEKFCNPDWKYLKQPERKQLLCNVA